MTFRSICQLIQRYTLFLRYRVGVPDVRLGYSPDVLAIQ